MKREYLFVVQKHKARTLHYDLRLEMNRVLKSWAVPRGAPRAIGEKHLAILTDDHPLSYANFEGEIPKGQYGAGSVKIWDTGSYENLKTKPLSQCFKEGLIEFRAHGNRMRGSYALVRFKGPKNWLLMKIKTKR